MSAPDKLVTIEPGMDAAALADILLGIQGAHNDHRRQSWHRTEVRGLSGGQIAVYGDGLR